MTKVFIGGSRHVTRLTAELCERLERIVEKAITVVVGDANGADKAVQRFFRDRSYEQVEVFASDQTPRNNLGHWPVRFVQPAHRTRDFDYYATKDRAMAHEATVGLMIWDGESRGTLLNILRLLEHKKTVVVYVAPRRSFSEIRSSTDFDRLVADLGRSVRRRVEEQAASEGLGHHAGPEQLRL